MSPVSDHDRTVVYLSILLALFLSALDQTIVATALPQMVADLEGVERYAWVATAYLLASTALALVYGKLADTYPRKFVTLGAVGLFLTGSVLSGMAGEFGDLPILGDGMTQLVLFRGIQGAGAGGIFAMAFIVIADLFTPAERGKYQGFVGAVFGIASVLGPLIGGLLTDHAGAWIPGVAGWRWVFYVNVPLGGLALWFIIRKMPRLDPPEKQVRPDFMGAMLLLGGLIPLIMALQIDKQRYPWIPGSALSEGSSIWQSWATLGLFFGGVALLSLFVRRSRIVPGPILDLRLFSEPVFRSATAASFFVGASFMSVSIFLPLFLVSVLGVSATQAGAALIPFSMGLVLSATLSGQFVNQVGYRRPIVAGAGIFFVAAVLLALMGPDVSYWQITVYMVMGGFGVGPSMPLLTLAIQNAADVRMIGQATSASQFFRQIGATVGAAVMGSVLAVTLSVSFATIGEDVLTQTNGEVVAQEYVATGGAELPGGIRTSFDDRAAREGDPVQAGLLRAEGARVSERVEGEVRDAFVRATRRIYSLTALLIAVAGMLAMRIPEIPLRTTHDRAEMAVSD
ncbi:MAG: MDR family MFS transporter, partial [Gemmatimonadetes bacterium]|nr:MDR family MFS transporter [Gemmatimonadota bacterium]